jgi:enamine deaminase RidA (YjgF/YER057c/UK114 family)
VKYNSLYQTSLHPPATLECYRGPEANELFVLTRPQPLTTDDIVQQTESAYRTLGETLSAKRASVQNVVTETVFFRNVREDLSAFLEARHRVLQDTVGGDCYEPASTFIEQPPLDPSLRLEISATAVVPHRPSLTFYRQVHDSAACNCGDCSRALAKVCLLGGQKQMYAGNVHGYSGSTFEEACSMFFKAEALLEEEGMSFRDVARTWIYLRDMENDYAVFNKARRAFFEKRGITLRPASTGINGVPFPQGHRFAMGFYAIEASRPLQMEAMTTKTLNEAWTYGSDFSRGMKVVEANKVALYVSGTASIDEEGRTVSVGDLEGQAERMLLNITTLLSRQGASFKNVVSAITYLKHPNDAPRLRRIFHNLGLETFPNALVKAAVCRPDLLCEMEVTAVLQ